VGKSLVAGKMTRSFRVTPLSLRRTSERSKADGYTEAGITEARAKPPPLSFF